LFANELVLREAMGCFKLHIESEPRLRLAYSKKAQKPIKNTLNYYPFGLQQKGYNNVISSNSNSSANKFQFNGKELQDELGLNIYDFGARNYDASIGRWHNLDQKAEYFQSWTPYKYALNNPIILTDPDGNCEWCKNVLKGSLNVIKNEVVGTLKTIGTIAITLRGDSSGAQARQDVANMAKGLGNLALGVAVSGSTIPGHVDVGNLIATDQALGTNTFGAMGALANSIDQFSNDLTSGDAERVSGAITSAALFLLPSKIDDVGKLGRFADNLTGINKKFSTGAVKDKGGLEAAISSAGYYDDVGEQGSHIFNSIAGGHIFDNGNKRTASEFIKEFANEHNLNLKLDDDGLKALTSEIGSHKGGLKYTTEEINNLLFEQ